MTTEAKPTEDLRTAVDMLFRLVECPPELRMDALVIVIKVYIEAGNHWSSLAHVWEKVVKAHG